MNLLPFDLSKPPHRETLDLIAPLLPGIFFEISIFWGRPDLRLTFNQLTAGLGHYGQILVAIFIAYFVGLAFSIFTSFLLINLKWCYRKDAFRLTQTENRVIYKYLGKKGQSTNWFLNTVLRPLYFSWTKRCMGASHFRSSAIAVWAAAAEQLLRARYGIEPPHRQNAGEQWQVWRVTLGTPTAVQVRGSTLVRAMYAAGWLGVVAVRIAPPLRNHYYLGTSLALIFVGFTHDLTLARNYGHPVYEVLGQINAVLDDIPKPELKSTTSSNENAEND
jgi:hypothetical protein